MFHTQFEIQFFLQGIIEAGAAAQCNFTLIFGISGADNQGLFGMLNLNKQRNQLSGTISHNNGFVIGIQIFSDAFAQRKIFPVRVGADGVDVAGQSFTQQR